MSNAREILDDVFSSLMQRPGIFLMVLLSRDGKAIIGYNRDGEILPQHLDSLSTLNVITSPTASQASKLDCLGPVQSSNLVCGNNSLFQVRVHHFH
eukprot:GHVH01012103.1.p1 GENE.GHVH01012103.1~~GHVH01012103.1.p1  ORF type:complete len:110 (+),score=8.28 GHVH01012103.1:45-332(+)